jgi:hypothetical protein
MGQSRRFDPVNAGSGLALIAGINARAELSRWAKKRHPEALLAAALQSAKEA